MTTALTRGAALLAVLLALTPSAPTASSQSAPVTIPFELATRHIVVSATIGKSRPLSFVLDTGAHTALVRMDVAKELGLKLDGTVNVGGAGPGVQQGSFARDANWALTGLKGFSQPVAFALPLPELPHAFGRAVDGIIGGEFIRQFVVEIDYQAKQLRLHQPASFTYKGPGQAVNVEFVNSTHPTISAIVTPAGRGPIERRFLFDIGASSALALHSPFVTEHGLLGSDAKTIRSVGGAGAGGRTTGRLGRVESLKIGTYTLNSPITVFSQDKAGAFANAALAGNIGAQIAMRFKVFLDYGRKRIIFEPTAGVAAPFDRAFSGLALRAYGADFRTFRVIEVLENSPASEVGIREGDVITSIDGVPAAKLTLSLISEMFEQASKYTVVIKRGDQTLTVALSPRRMI